MKIKNHILLFQLPGSRPTTKKCAPFFRGNMEFPIYFGCKCYGRKSVCSNNFGRHCMMLGVWHDPFQTYSIAYQLGFQIIILFNPIISFQSKVPAEFRTEPLIPRFARTVFCSMEVYALNGNNKWKVFEFDIHTVQCDTALQAHFLYAYTTSKLIHILIVIVSLFPFNEAWPECGRVQNWTRYQAPDNINAFGSIVVGPTRPCKFQHQIRWV
jgi:hypothetical protein